MRQKRFLSWIMVFTLLVGMFSFPAYAEGNTTTISGDGTAEKTGTMTVTLVIPKKTPAATDLTYTAPSELTYSGSDKAATVAVASGVTGLGTITVKYYSDAARTTEVTETKNVGTYYVGVTVAEGDEYAASTAVVYGDGWTFAITPSTPSAPNAPTMASATKNSITLNTVGGCEYSNDGASWQDSTEFTGLSPSTEYTFYQRVKETANTNPSAASVGSTFSTEADTYGMTITLTIEPKITGYALELGGVLGLRYYMALPTGTDIDYTDAKMTFSMNYREDQVIPYSDLETDDQGRFFTCGVYAYQMADEITATFTYKKDGETQTLTDTYSVKQYLDSLKGSEYSGAALNLVNATRAYGHFIQPYLARVNGWTVGGKYAALDYTGTVDVGAALVGSEASKFTLATMESAYVQAAQYRLLLNADTSFIVEVRLKEAPSENVTMTIDSTEVTPTVSGTAYRVELGNIAANNLGVTHHVVMKIGDKTVFDFIASPMSYVYTVLNKSSPAEDEQNALAALYEYWQAAAAYNSQN